MQPKRVNCRSVTLVQVCVFVVKVMWESVDLKLIRKEGNDRDILWWGCFVLEGIMVEVVVHHEIRKGVSCNPTHRGHNPTSHSGLDDTHKGLRHTYRHLYTSVIGFHLYNGWKCLQSEHVSAQQPPGERPLCWDTKNNFHVSVSHEELIQSLRSFTMQSCNTIVVHVQQGSSAFCNLTSFSGLRHFT